MFEILREVDGGHPASPDLALDCIAISERAPEALELCGHHAAWVIGRGLGQEGEDVRIVRTGGTAWQGPSMYGTLRKPTSMPNHAAIRRTGPPLLLLAP